MVRTDTAKADAVKAARAQEAKPVHVPRQPKPKKVIKDTPLVMIEIKRDLGQTKMPFDPK